MANLFSQGEIDIIKAIITDGIFEYKSLAKFLDCAVQTIKNRLRELGRKIQYMPVENDAANQGLPLETGLSWGFADVLYMALEWQRGEYVGDGICKTCYQSLNDDSIQAVAANDLCFAHSLENRVLSIYSKKGANYNKVQ